MKAQFVEVAGLRTRCLVAGTGRPILLLNPVGYPAEVFVRALEGLAQRFQLIAVDLPGQGFSEAPSRWHDAPQIVMAEHVVKVADTLGLDAFALLGSSLGGLVAALVALHAPDRVVDLVLVGTGSVFNAPPTQAATLEQVYANGSRAYADPSLSTLKSRLANTCHVMPPADDVLLATLTAYAWPGAEETYRTIMHGLIASVTDVEASAFGRLEMIGTRTLVIVGANDVRTSFEAHQQGVARMPNARLVKLEQCGHLPFLEQPEAFNAAVAQFLGSAEAPPAAHAEGLPTQ